MLENLAERVNADADLVRRGRFINTTFLIAIYSRTTDAMLEVARRTGAPATIMKDVGHFPMREDPPKFIGYLLPVLDKIRAA